MKTLKKRGLCGGLKRNRRGNKWTNIPRTVMKNGFVCTTNILLFVLAILTSLIVLLLLSPKLLSSPHLADHHHLCSNSQGEGLNEERLCNAIFYSEGGYKTHYFYGIKSVSCATKMECKAVCIKTMRHYKKDFARHGGHGVKNFIKYASFRYVGLRDRTREAWEKNVNFYCKKQGGCYE